MAIAFSGLASLLRVPGFKLENVSQWIKVYLELLGSDIYIASEKLRVVNDVGRDPQWRRECICDRTLQRDLVSSYPFFPFSAPAFIRSRCFIGYSNANYALAEVRDPVKTMKRAAPLAMLSVTLVYMLVNIAYYAVVDRAELVGSGRIAAALYFGRLWGVGAERVCVVTTRPPRS